jgi:hypothetical protein
MATKGQPATEPWEKWRAIAWVQEVQRRTQAKMDNKLPAGDPFINAKKQIQLRWSVPQRKTQNPNEITLNDLKEALLGATRIDFHNYANGNKARLGSKTLAAVDTLLPGSQRFFEVGPNGVPLWAALRGEITVKDFWEPLVRSGQVTDTLELFLEDTDWQEEGRAMPRPSLIGKRGNKLSKQELHVLDGLIAYESGFRLPNLPWKDLVRALSLHTVPVEFRNGSRLESAIVERRARDIWLSMGDGVLAIALAHQARAHRFASNICPTEACEDLRTILEGLIPIWHRWESFYSLGMAITDEIKLLAAPL